MLIRIPRGWEIPERDATPESLVFGRRAALKAAGLGIGLGAGAIAPAALAQEIPAAIRNPRFVPGREITAEKDATTYNNYYEFGTDKGIYRPAQKLPQRPWTVKIDGFVDTPREFGIEDLLKTMPLEERLYRLRCVEAWSMVVPWTGFPMAALLKAVGPKPEANTCASRPPRCPPSCPAAAVLVPLALYRGLHRGGGGERPVLHGGRRLWQAAAAAERRPDPLPPPWKYGFKAGKSLVQISLVAERPKTFWEAIQASEYGFWANVNPEVSHPRWSQASERVLGTGDRVPTQLFNGYGSSSPACTPACRRSGSGLEALGRATRGDASASPLFNPIRPLPPGCGPPPRSAPAPRAPHRSPGSACCRSAPPAAAAPPGRASARSPRHSRAAPRRVLPAPRSRVAARRRRQSRSSSLASGVSSAAAFGSIGSGMAGPGSCGVSQFHQRLRALLQRRHQRPDPRRRALAPSARSVAMRQPLPAPRRSAAHRRPGGDRCRSDASAWRSPCGLAARPTPSRSNSRIASSRSITSTSPCPQPSRSR